MELTNNWSYPTTVWAGPGRIADLAPACIIAGIKRPLIVTDRGLADHANIKRASALLGGAPVFSDVKGNPVAANLDAGLAHYAAEGSDGVVAIGGGSALDIGKLIAFMAGQVRPVWEFEDVADNWTRARAQAIAPVIAIPTTAGTGSEVGRASVLTRDDTREKKIIFHPGMMPSVVILDPELTIGLPPNLTAATGMDAFVHCLEAYCAPGFHPLADGIALEGMRLIKEYLPRAFDDGADIEARAHMLAAATMGATAFQKGLGAVHALAHPIGAIYDVHHGLTNAILLPYVIRFNRAAIVHQLDTIARLLDLPAGDAAGFEGWVLSFRKRLKIPASLKEIGISEADAAAVGEAASLDPSAQGNPIPVDATSLERIFRMAVRGELAF
jgi:alcohol dehydrogenase class IV